MVLTLLSLNCKVIMGSIYTPFTSSLANSTLIDVDGPGGGLYTSPGYGSETEGGGSFSIDSIEKELFFFEYGVVVCWGLSKEEEKAVLKLLVPFEEDKIGINFLIINLGGVCVGG